MQYLVGTSFVAQFAGGHDFPAILRELVQNEYDAGGTVLDVEFRGDSLVIRGNGSTIDRKGWDRLKVMVGTGQIAGTRESVESKANGIGSKNFGLRSLFLIGDTIHIRSGGKKNALDWRYGTYGEPQPDVDSGKRSGVEIVVPYRVDDVASLPAFDLAREQAALDGLADGLAATLTKLAKPGRVKSLRSVHVKSVRHDRELSWNQVARSDSCRLRDVQAICRSINVQDSRAGNTSRTEVEFVRAARIPDQFRGKPIPGYFLRRRGRTDIAVSFRLHRGKLLDEPGRWFYPIGVESEGTGTALSVSAPFDMDSDRSAIISSTVSDWNRWLIDKAVELAVDLLKADWWDRFGADVYVALWPRDTPRTPFGDRLRDKMHVEPVWPVCDSKGRITVAVAQEMVVAAEPALEGFLSRDRYPPAVAMGNKRFRDVLLAAGGKSFSINSLVRLRCGAEKAALVTKVESSGANSYYSDYVAQLSKLDLQVQFAHSLDALERRLSKENRKDLKSTASTLSASGELRPASVLKKVPKEIASVCPLPTRDRLHPMLLFSRVLRHLTDAFEENVWVLDVAQRATAEKATDHERTALYRHILAKRGRFRPATLAAIRGAPVIRDSRGDWIAPSMVLLRRTPGISAFSEALRFPQREIENDPELTKALRLRDKLSSSDLVGLARWTAENRTHASDLETLLHAHTKLLVPSVAKELQGIPFMQASKGGLSPPEGLYIDSVVTRTCVGNLAGYYAGNLPPALAARLGCQSAPFVADMLAQLQSLEEKNEAPRNVEIVYPELIATLKREKTNPRTLAERSIAWTDIGWAKPADTVLTAMLSRLPAGSIPRPMSRAERVLAAYEQLGAVRQPSSRHWSGLLIWAGKRFGSSKTPNVVRQALRNAYAQLGAEPGTFPADVPLLLDTVGRLHAISATHAGLFLLNDDPLVAAALSASGSEHAFADVVDPRTHKFYHAVGVRSLRSVGSFVKFSTSGEKHFARSWPDELIARLHSPVLADAIAVLVGHRVGRRADLNAPRGQDIARRLAGIRELVFVDEITEHYRVGKTSITISARSRRDRERVYFAGIRAKSEAHSVLAEIVSRDLPEDEHYDWTDAVYRLMAAERVSEIGRYLTSKGVQWRAHPGAGEDDESELDDVEVAVTEMLGPLFNGQMPKSVSPSPSVTPTQPVSPSLQQSRPTLPNLDSVDPALVPLTGALLRVGPSSGGGGGWSGGGGQMRDELRDRDIGIRGEEIVLRLERVRLREAGLDEARAIWVAKDNPAANHDIVSIDADGETIWIEVKASSGIDGRFRWSRSEFELAVHARERYILYRVYGADTVRPTVKAFRNPVAMLVGDRLRLDLAVLQAEIEPA